MTRSASTAALLCLGVLAAGCSRFTYDQPQPQPLALPNAQGVPRQPVAEGSNLQPLVVAPGQDQPYASTVPGGTLGPDGQPIGVDGQPLDEAQPQDVANASPDPAPASTPAAPKTAEIGRTELLGGWTVASAGNSCKLFMTLTTWSGGYRANTRGCGQGGLGGISAWDLNGAQIVLKDADGAALATLYKSSNEHYSGRTEAGQAISFYR